MRRPSHSVLSTAAGGVRAAIAAGRRRDQVGDQKGGGNQDEHRDEWHDGFRNNADPLGEDRPPPASRGDPEGNADQDRDRDDRRRLPGDDLADLLALEAEDLEDREIAPTPSDRADQGVEERCDRDHAQQGADHDRDRMHTAVIGHVDRLGPGEGVEARQARHRFALVDPGLEAREEVVPSRVGRQPPVAVKRQHRPVSKQGLCPLDIRQNPASHDSHPSRVGRGP